MKTGDNVYLATQRCVLMAVGNAPFSRRGTFASLEAAKACIESMLSPELKAVARWEDRELFSDLWLNSDLVNYAVARVTILTVEG